MGPLPERQVIAMLRGGVHIEAVARQLDKHWWDPTAYPPFAAALLEAQGQAEAPESWPQVRPRRRVIWLGACLSLLTGLAWWASPTVRRAAGQPGAEQFAAVDPQAEPRAAPPVELTAPPIAPCDIEALWFRGEQLTPAQRRANIAETVGGWSTDCRWQAMESLCRGGCDGLLSDTLLSAAPKGERAALAKLRSERNHDVALRGRALYTELSEIARWALPPAHTEQAASKIPAILEACQEHIAKDAVRIEGIRQELDGAGPHPAGGFWMKEALAALQSCCESDRSQCADVARFLKSADDDIRERDHRAEADKRAMTAARAH
jgi:hypothetical protein